MIGIYKITNKTNGKCYIGQSQNIELRWRAHKHKYLNKNDTTYSSKLYRAMRAHGIENFDFSVIEECDVNSLKEREIYYISQYDSLKNGYNMTPGGDTSSTTIVDKSIVQKIIQLLKTTTDNSEVIASRFGVSSWFVRSINRGESYANPEESYPIRKHLGSIRRETRLRALQSDIIKMDGGAKPKNKGVEKPIREKIKQEKTKVKKDRAQQKVVKNERLRRSPTNRPRKVERPEPLELARLVKEFGFEKVGKRYGVSGKAVSKWCATYQIPQSKKELVEWYNKQVGIIEYPKPAHKKPEDFMKKVNKLDIETGSIIATYKSVSDAARSVGKERSASHISDACRSGKTSYGYRWSFA